jgi:cell division transport system permease protein
LVIAIALALPASFHVLIRNAQQASGEFKVTHQISLFLRPDLTDEIGRKIAEKLNHRPQVKNALLLTKQAGLEELRSYSGFGDALKFLDFNPLPTVINIIPKDSVAPEDLEKLVADLEKMGEADFVQVDSQWLHKLRAILAIADRCIRMFSVLLGLGVLFIVGNTIRLELQNRHEEIAVTKLLGATDRFIRRPFVYTGFWFGFLGGGLAWLLVNLLILILRSPAKELAELYGSPFTLSFLSFTETELLLGSSVLLGIIGASIVVSYYLRKLDPRR